ncbi:MAG: hypothetical protein AAF664_23665 [Planctomycetota bacterium]
MCRALAELPTFVTIPVGCLAMLSMFVRRAWDLLPTFLAQERQEVLSAQCQDDPDLKSRLQKLLAAHDAKNSLLNAVDHVGMTTTASEGCTLAIRHARAHVCRGDKGTILAFD